MTHSDQTGPLGDNPVVVDFIRNQPGMAGRLLAVHQNDGSGRCRVCSEGGQAGRKSWPCQLYSYAREASKR